MEESTDIYYDKIVDIDNTIIYALDDMIVKLGVVLDLDSESKMIKIQSENDIIYFSINDNGYILSKTDDYNIIDIEVVENFEFDSLDDNIEISLTKDIYPNIEILVEEKSIYEYNSTEKRESLISSLVKNMNVYDDPIKLKRVAIISQNFMDMIENYKNIDFDHFYDIYYFDVFKKLPDWLIPLCKNHKRLYLEPDDIVQPLVQENIVQVVQSIEDQTFYESLDSSDTYQNIIDIYNDTRYKSIQNLNIENGYTLKQYPYDTFRDCLDDSCVGIRDNYSIDTRRNYKNFSVKYDDENYSTTIRYQKCNLSGLIYLSDQKSFKLPFQYDNDTLSLFEKCNIIENYYSIYNEKTLSDILSENTQTINTKLDDEFLYKYNSDTNYDNISNMIYKFSDKYTLDDIYKILNKYIPKQDTIVKNYIYDNIFQYIYNYDDFKKVFIRYDLNIDNISQNNKSFINDILEKNIKNYKNYYDKNYDKFIVKSKDILLQNIPQIGKLLYLRDLIHKQKNIVYQNYLYDKYIKNFTILDKYTHKLVSKYDNTPLLCEHYCLQCKTDTDPNMFDILKEEFGDEKNDGIYCKYCCELLYDVEMSNFLGFDGNVPIINKTIVETKNYTYDDINLKEFIISLSKNLGVELHEDDVYSIYNNTLNIDHINLSDIRYNIVLSYQNFPGVEEIKNSKQKLIFINKIKKYSESTNIVLFIICNLYIYIQTSIPAYKTGKNISILNFNDDIYTIDDNRIKELLVVLNRLNKKYNDNKYFKYIGEFLNDSNVELENSDIQLTNILSYILSSKYANIIIKIQNYSTYIGYNKNVYLKPYFPTFRPLNTDKDIIDINKVVNDSISIYKDFMIKSRNNRYTLENISFLQNIKTYENTKIYVTLKIKNLELLTNKAFLTLYEFIITCSGKQDVDITKNNYIKLLIDRFNDTMKEGEVYKTIFKRNEWLKNDKVIFKNLREILVNIFRYCKGNGDCTKTLKVYNHLVFNNSKLLLTNVYPKRSYDYIFIDLIPDTTQEYLKDLPLIQKFYNSYCYDINKRIVKRDNSDSKHKSLYIDTDFKYDFCDENLSIKTDFKDILNTIYIQNSLVLPNTKHDYSFETSKRLIKLLSSSEYIKIPKLYELYQTIESTMTTDIDVDTKNTIIKNLDKIFDKLYEDTICMKDKVLGFVNDKNLNNFDDIIQNDIVDDVFYKNNTKYLIYIISKIKNKTNTKIKGCNSDNYMISDTWKMSDSNIETLGMFMKLRRYKLLSDKYSDKPSKNVGYYKYIKDQKCYILFQKLYQMYIDYDKYIYLINGKKDDIFDKNKMDILLKYIYMMSFYKIYEFINLSDDCDIEMVGNELFDNLNIDYDNSIESDNNILKEFLKDMIIDNIQIYNNKDWIYKLNGDNSLLENKLAKQSENEKQILVNKLTEMDGQERNLYMSLQNMGDSNWFKDAEIMNNSLVNDALREEYLKELQMEHDDTEVRVVREDAEEGYTGTQDFDDIDLDDDDMDGNLAPTDIHFD